VEITAMALGQAAQNMLDSVAMIVYFILFGWNSYYASIIGLVVQIVCLAIKYRVYFQALEEKPPKKLSFPKYFDTMQLILFFALAGATLNKKINQWNTFIWTASFGLVSVLSIICDRPFVEQYARDHIPERVRGMA
jgi:hypothetical protein